MSYTAIPNGDVDVDSPATTALFSAFRDNPLAINEGTAGAPVNQSAWHPYDLVTVGDGNDGVIYDFAVDGAVTSIVTPDFEDGYEYMVLIDSMGIATAGALQIAVYFDTYAAYLLGLAVGISASPNTSSFSILMRAPRRSRRTFYTEMIYKADAGNSAAAAVTSDRAYGLTNADTALKIRIQDVTGSKNTDAGVVTLLRRREYSSG